MNTIDISDINKAPLLAALFNSSKAQGMGFLQDHSEEMTVSEAEDLIEQNPSMRFDYVRGRVLKVDIGIDQLETDMYDRDNGAGAAEKVIEVMLS